MVFLKKSAKTHNFRDYEKIVNCAYFAKIGIIATYLGRKTKKA